MSWRARVIILLATGASLFIVESEAGIREINNADFEGEGIPGKNLALGLGNIGCTFSNAVCDPKLEFCYNDNVFGRCLPQFGTPSESNLYRYSLSKSDMHLLEKEIERLFAQGYRWGHSYTQCILQNLLNGLRHGLDLERITEDCSEDQDQDLKGAMKAFADEINPWDLAFIKYAPSNTNSNPYGGNADVEQVAHASDFANEMYVPSKLEEEEDADDGMENPTSPLEEIRAEMGQNKYPIDNINDEKLLDALLQNYLLEELLVPSGGGVVRPLNSKKSMPAAAPEMDQEWQENPQDDQGLGLRVNEKIIQPRVFSTLYNTPELFRNGLETRDAFMFNNQPDISTLTKSDPEEDEEIEIPLEFLDRNQNKIKLNAEDLAELEQEVENLIQQGGNEDEAEGPPERGNSALFTEGGLVFLNNNPKRFFYQDVEGDEDAQDEEDVYGLGGDNRNGFERRERLDVKKPGPWYRTVNNFAFDYNEDAEKGNTWEEQQAPFISEFGPLGPADMMKPKKTHTSLNRVASPLTLGMETKARESRQPDGEMGELMKLMKKASAPANADNLMAKASNGDLDEQLDIIDTSYVNVVVSNKIGGWTGAQDLVNLLADLLDLKHSTFIEVRQTEDVVTFKVEPNEKKLNSTEIARRIEKLSPEVEKESGVKIVKARVGIRTNKIKPPVSVAVNRRFFDEDAAAGVATIPVQYPNSSIGQTHGSIMNDPSNSPAQLPLYAAEGGNNNLYITTFATCGVVAAILVAAFTIYFVRRNAKSKEKFARLAQDDPSMEACRDYQDLCRARMASKNNEKTEPLRAVQRVQSHTSKDSEGGTSSSRSSTSSWTEEPVHTNMDISTGHMVLSYMEDHLKNKDRLDQEWAALCAYEADPGITSIAEKPENAKKNRYSNSLPFDHSRVILNDLANISGSDYINASTITDHDPRNPAYIATQGPMATTSADFWQMVWEQGSVVIVSLTRLSDNGTALCHRYWPEEGSELLHIYEVHLVSEHIWCEEYLVRSFYLKNVKTGETRTVTQFQFLAWPENGVPTSTKALLEFRRKVNKSYRGRSCPIIVHCSDGAGRTGTYCLIDMVLNRMRKGAKEIDIAASLEHIRDQRPGMVRTKQQFEFVLMAVAEEVHAILKALPQ